jgi:hypothetical protein
MAQHNPEQSLPDDGVRLRRWPGPFIGLLELTEEFFRQASSQVRVELVLFRLGGDDRDLPADFA